MLCCMGAGVHAGAAFTPCLAGLVRVGAAPPPIRQKNVDSSVGSVQELSARAIQSRTRGSASDLLKAFHDVGDVTSDMESVG